MTIQKTIHKFENVRHIRVNGEKYSCCDWYEYDTDKKAWLYFGELFCAGWYKKGETIYKKWWADKQG